jgi:fido (protein-threonine AMPylation protein)
MSRKMAGKQEIDGQLQALERVIAGAGGLLAEEIEARADLGLNRRTLQRRLDALLEQGRISKAGGGRATRYRAAAVAPAEAPQADMFVPLSRTGSEIMRLVSAPLATRTPVAYNRAFLDSYQPNRTNYLNAAEKARLHELGRTAAMQEAAGTYALQILNRLLIDLSWNSSRLEGNTYSLLDTQRLIELGQAAEEKAPRDAQMILNHKAAIEFLVQSANEIGFNRHTLLNLHALLADNLLEDQGAAGRLRHEGVAIGGSVYMPPEIPQLIEECFDLLLAKAAAIEDPFEAAFFVMIQLPYLQPFIDVNKRVSRLAMNIPLIRRNLAPLSFIAVPDQTYTRGLLGVYEFNRIELIKDVFLWAYEKSSSRYVAIRQTLGEPDPFRLRYRAALREVVAEAIRGGMNQKAAAAHVSAYAASEVPSEDRARFIEAAETELLSLHEGNFARYGVRPSEFNAWRAIWERKS